MHLIVDNCGIHKHLRVQSWLKRHPPFHLHPIPISSSWLSMVERWFRGITDKRLRRGTFESECALIKGGVGGGEKMVHFDGSLDHLETKIFRPGSAVKAARKRAEGLALTALIKAGTQLTRWSQVDRQSGPFFRRHQQIKAINAYIDNHNQSPKAFGCNASFESITLKLDANVPHRRVGVASHPLSRVGGTFAANPWLCCDAFWGQMPMVSSPLSLHSIDGRCNDGRCQKINDVLL